MDNSLKVSDKELFLKYAFPCGQVLVNRGNISQEFHDEIKRAIVGNKEIKEDYIKPFKVALFFLTEIAKKQGKTAIDKEIIRDYYFERHDDVVKWRAEVKPDVIVDSCRVKPGKILSIEKNTLVETPLGNLEIKLDFIPDANVGDFITIHYEYGCEIITEKLFKKLWKNF
jgi:hydrogenase maturation factor